MDWEGMRDTSPGNPSVVICSRHYQTYFTESWLTTEQEPGMAVQPGPMETMPSTPGLEGTKDYCNLMVGNGQLPYFKGVKPEEICVEENK